MPSFCFALLLHGYNVIQLLWAGCLLLGWVNLDRRGSMYVFIIHDGRKVPCVCNYLQSKG